MSLPPLQAHALDLLLEQEKYGYDEGRVTAEATCTADRQAFIHWRTASALYRRGLVTLNSFGFPDGTAILLTVEGREAARQVAKR